MGILRRIENRLEGAFEGGFGRTFRSPVQPVEVARKLAKEMDDHRTISVSRVYVPNVYTVFLSPDDREQFTTYEASLRAELAGYLNEHARREGYSLPGRTRVVIETALELPVGSFGIAVEMDEAIPEPEPAVAPVPEPVADAPPPAAAGLPPEFLVADAPADAEAMIVAPVHAPAPVAVPAPVPVPPVAPVAPVAAESASDTRPISPHEAVEHGLVREEWALTWSGGRTPIARRAVVIGRSRDCDVVLADGNVSRRHAELILRDGGFMLRDLDSTNGSQVNGRRVRESMVGPDDIITVGTTTLRLERART